MPTTIADPFCECGYRESLHDLEDGARLCPLRAGFENVLGKMMAVMTGPEWVGQVGHTFHHSDMFNRP